jgi:GH15 family glucan-1,4-alpha-glucosidase
MEMGVPAGRAVRVTSGGTRSPPRARYLPIAEHGLIGDLHTVALVGTDGTIDWYCCPQFDSPSVFAAILDAGHGACSGSRPTVMAGVPSSSTSPTPTSLLRAS